VREKGSNGLNSVYSVQAGKSHWPRKAARGAVPEKEKPKKRQSSKVDYPSGNTPAKERSQPETHGSKQFNERTRKQTASFARYYRGKEMKGGKKNVKENPGTG